MALARIQEIERRDHTQAKPQKSRQSQTITKWLIVDIALLLVTLAMSGSLRCTQNRYDVMTNVVMACCATSLAYLTGEIQEMESIARTFLRLFCICFLSRTS